jgi:hypothetical protein
LKIQSAHQPRKEIIPIPSPCGRGTSQHADHSHNQGEVLHLRSQPFLTQHFNINNYM